MWDVSKEVFFNFLLGFSVGLVVSWLTWIIFSVLFKKELQSSQSKTYTAVRFGMVIFALLLTVSFSSRVHSWRDYGFTSNPSLTVKQEIIHEIANAMEEVPAFNEPLNEPLNINTDPCRYENLDLSEYDDLVNVDCE